MPLKPPDFLVNRLQETQCILFVGSGLSAAAGLPTWRGLLEDITGWAERHRPGAVSVAEVETLLAKDKFMEVAQHLRDSLGLEDLQRALAERLDVENRTLPAVHKLIAQLPFRAIVTTNFDQLIERAYDHQIPVATHLDAERLAEYIGDPNHLFLLKAHGDVTRADTIVLAEQEFSRLINRDEAFKRSFISLIMTNAVLFVGYSLADPDFRLLLDDQADLFGKGGPPRFALMTGLTEIERKNLSHKTIQVLQYENHDQVPEFFQLLLEAMQQEPAAETTKPPDALPSLLLRGARPTNPHAARRLDPASIITQFENATELEIEVLLLHDHPEIRQALREHLGDERYVRLRAQVAAQVERRLESAAPGNVILLPSMLGSQLSVRNASGRSSVVWIDLLRLLRGDFRKLSLGAGAPDVAATGILRMAYLGFTQQLEKRWNVRVFFYDWRRDFNEVANELRRFLASEFGEGEPCHFVAHGSGGLVARAFISQHRDAWERLRPAGVADSAGGRLVLLGTPNHGSFAPLRTLTGKEATLRVLALVDLRSNAEDIRRVFATFPSFYQMLPSPLRNPAWEALYDAHSYGGLEVSQELFDRGLAFHETIASAVEPERMVCILGNGQPTAADVDKPNDLLESERWIVTREGDGLTPHTLARLELGGAAVPTYFVDERSGDLTTNQHVAGAVDEILRFGVTFGLRTTPDAPLQRRLTPEEKLEL
jgi:pimeloyl-ACP methyl ester carboxylesterase